MGGGVMKLTSADYVADGRVVDGHAERVHDLRVREVREEIVVQEGIRHGVGNVEPISLFPPSV